MRRWLLFSAAAAVVLLGVAGWQLGLFSSDPAEVSLAETVAAIAREEAEIQEAQATTTVADTAVAADAASDTTGCSLDTEIATSGGVATAVQSADDLGGTWIIETGDQTFVGYRIDEILSGVDFTAVGRSSGVTGSIEFQDGVLTSAEIVANLSWLTSDSRIRDEQMKSQALQTNRFPAACFVLDSPTQLPEVPAPGEAVSVTVDGTFTIHGVSQAQSLTLDATVVGERLAVVGSTIVSLADHDIETPSAPAVAGVSDTATVEFSLVLAR
jgi:polyisoprenoid-binding protein YceI